MMMRGQWAVWSAPLVAVWTLWRWLLGRLSDCFSSAGIGVGAEAFADAAVDPEAFAGAGAGGGGGKKGSPLQVPRPRFPRYRRR